MLGRQIAQVDRLSWVDPFAALIGHNRPMSKGTPWYVPATRLRKEQKLSLQRLGDLMGYSKSTVGHWLTGHNPAPLIAIKEMAKILGTTEIMLLADDPFYITDPEERAIIEALRDLPEKRRTLALKLLHTLGESPDLEAPPPDNGSDG
jgi:transcriptional regulator with XRE-family HTH domain